ncbi:MAG: xanthine dehydrogenase family protein subunit M [Clostridia bacterium]|nr:xanthine dehydrogenase family protein subunit M [Clostridia bacterium]MDD4798335.1 xanthine dehydrogenase family protein subunit M [Clostridia bacterium]
MADYSYIKAKNIKQAMELLEQPNSIVSAGGSVLLLMIKEGAFPNGGQFVDITGLPELRGITFEDGKLRIGALVTVRELLNSPLVAEYLPALFDACSVFADPLTRNTATIGGNFAVSSPSADCVIPLIAIGAQLELLSKAGKRIIACEELFCGPGQNTLKKGELISAVIAPFALSSAFCKQGLRKAMAISVATAAASLSLDCEGIITSCRLALGSVAPVPLRIYATEKLLVGKNINDDLLPVLRDSVKQQIKPIDDCRSTAEYRLELAPVLLSRAVVLAGKRYFN